MSTIDINTFRDDLMARIENGVNEEMVFCPRILGYASDMMEQIRYDLPDTDTYVPGAYDGDSLAAAEAWLSDVESDLDVDGYSLRESLEGLFDGIVYNSDISAFWDEYSDYCEEAVNEMGGVSELAASCDSVSGIVSSAVQWGAAQMWREYVNEVIESVRIALEQARDILDQAEQD